MSVILEIKEAAVKSIRTLYNIDLNAAAITVNATKPEFEGDYTIVLFSFVKLLKNRQICWGMKLVNGLFAKMAICFAAIILLKAFLTL